MHCISEDDDKWFYVSYMNLNSYRGDFLGMELDGVSGRASAAAARGNMSLKVADPLQCYDSWDMAAALSPSHDWAMELFVVSGSMDVLAELDISCIECSRYSVAYDFWPPRVRAARLRASNIAQVAVHHKPIAHDAPAIADRVSVAVDGLLEDQIADIADDAPDIGVGDPLHDINDLLDEGASVMAQAEAFLHDDVPLDDDEVQIGRGRGRGRKRAAEQMSARGRGRSVGGDRQAYHADTVFSMEDEELPIGLLRVYHGGSQLTAQCLRCKLRVNRQFTPHHERPGAFPTGRPAGTLLAGLQQPCDGDQIAHRQNFFLTGTFERRKMCRQWQLDRGLLQAAFAAERPPRGAFEKKHLEPRDQC